MMVGTEKTTIFLRFQTPNTISMLHYLLMTYCGNSRMRYGSNCPHTEKDRISGTNLINTIFQISEMKRIEAKLPFEILSINGEIEFLTSDRS